MAGGSCATGAWQVIIDGPNWIKIHQRGFGFNLIPQWTRLASQAGSGNTESVGSHVVRVSHFTVFHAQFNKRKCTMTDKHSTNTAANTVAHHMTHHQANNEQFAWKMTSYKICPTRQTTVLTKCMSVLVHLISLSYENEDMGRLASAMATGPGSTVSMLRLVLVEQIVNAESNVSPLSHPLQSLWLCNVCSIVLLYTHIVYNKKWEYENGDTLQPGNLLRYFDLK